MFGGTDEFLTWDGTDDSKKDDEGYGGFFKWKFGVGVEPQRDADGNPIKENDETLFQQTVTVEFEGSAYNSQSLEEKDEYKNIKKIFTEIKRLGYTNYFEVEKFYWTSTECFNDASQAYDFTGSNFYRGSKSSTGNTLNVVPVCAF
jgi:hypothetical protein